MEVLIKGSPECDVSPKPWTVAALTLGGEGGSGGVAAEQWSWVGPNHFLTVGLRLLTHSMSRLPPQDHPEVLKHLSHTNILLSLDPSSPTETPFQKKIHLPCEFD